MSKCEAGACGISCPGPCACGGSGSHCSCACFAATVATKSHGDAARSGSTPFPEPVVSGAGLVTDRPFDIDFKDAPLVAVASFLVPDAMQQDVCIPVPSARTAVTRADKGIGLPELLRSLGLRLTGRAAA